ncbi:MAG: alkaline phosphatase family protein [Candidatus Thermoplasmatota archaeon]|nr:alkaline phosphatase family protein [Candidatus Thermoplasmatota archaeon]
MRQKLVVIGLDGATFRYLDPLMAQGKLPTLAKIAKEGVRATLESVRPPISCPAWFCYSTGRNPGKLGIFGWRNFDPATCGDRFNDYKALTTAEMWDYLGQAGLKSAVINIPTMFPPKAIHGYMVSGMQAQDHQMYTHPAELKEELIDRFDYRVQPKAKMLWDHEEAYKDIVALFKSRLDVALHLLDKVDLLHTTIFHIDEIQHNAWNQPELATAWEHIDGLLADFLDALPEGTDVLFMSDHGFCERSVSLNLNTWLAQEGYLVRHENKAGEVLRRLGITRPKLERLLKRTHLLDLAKAIVPDNIQTVVKEEDGSTSHQRRLAEIDWDRTVAFCSTHFTLHVLDPEKRQEIMDKLEALEGPKGGKVFQEVLPAEDHLHGDKMSQAPQILLLPNEPYAVGDAVGKPLWTESGPANGGHAMDGILMATGPSFKPGASPEDAKLVDLAPTILHYFGLPVTEDMDGTVLDILADERAVTYTKEDAATGAFSEQELEQVEERLRGLGYLE